jgi:hypothetical protein
MKTISSGFVAMKHALLFLLITANSAFAVDCRSVGGHLNGEQVSVFRQVALDGNQLVLSGWFGSTKAPVRVLSCAPLYSGVLCTREFGPVVVTVMSNDARMTETVTDKSTGKEIGGIAYRCDSRIMIGE